MSFSIRVFTTAAVLICFSLSFASTEINRADPPLFAVGVDMVFLKATVSDRLNRRVAGLPKEYFHIYEDSVEQSILSFSEETAPVSMGLIFDISGSMRENGKIQEARAALIRLLKRADPGDEFFLLTFNETPTLTMDFTRDTGFVSSQAAIQGLGGRTALYDAIYAGLSKIRTGKNERKAIIIFSDFEENSSRYKLSEVNDYSKELDVQIYAIGEPEMQKGLMTKPFAQAMEYRRNRLQVENMAGMTGGQAFFPANVNEIDNDVDLIYSELRNEYVLGYVPTSANHDGKWRRIQVKLDRSVPNVVVHARGGYYTSKY